MDIKNWIILLSIIVFLFGIFQASDAAEPMVDITLDKVTLDRGYTVGLRDDFFIPVMPRHFNGYLNIRINKTDYQGSLPEGKVLTSDFYTYQVDNGRPGFFPMPVLLSVKHNDNATYFKKNIYFFDNYQKEWRPLPTEESGEYARAKTIFPYALVAVFGDEEASFTAASAILARPETGEILFEKNIDEVRSLASLTKLMTALVFLEHNPGWDKKVVMQNSDFVGGASMPCEPGDIFTVRDLFYTTIIASKNNATEALVRSTGLTDKEFVELMNRKAYELGLLQTHFIDPTGLGKDNTGIAREIIKLAQTAFDELPIRDASARSDYKVTNLRTGNYFKLYSTSQRLFAKNLPIVGTKTGYTDEAGYNLVTRINDSKDSIALVMGAAKGMNYEEVARLLASE